MGRAAPPEPLAGADQCDVAFARAPKSAKRSDPIERAGTDIKLDGASLTCELDPLAIETVLVKFARTEKRAGSCPAADHGEPGGELQRTQLES